MTMITIKGGRAHNLKNVDVSIPKNQLVVATGVSGSGKSSLMFDIVFAEGRNQYLQAIGILAGLDEEPNFDELSGIGPTIAVQQQIIRQSNPRSTVGSRTRISHLLGLLYASEAQVASTEWELVPDQLTANFFSANAPAGMCLTCSGRGSYFKINIEQLITSPDCTLAEVLVNAGVTPGYLKVLERRFSSEFQQPYKQLAKATQDEVLYGLYDNGKQSFSLQRLFEGNLARNKANIEGVYTKVTCPACEGFRIGEEARQVFLNGKHIGQLSLMTFDELALFFEELSLKNNFSSFGKNTLSQLLTKTRSLIKARLGHLSLYREMPTLSGGEIQRLFLNSHLDSKMSSLIYILDEPTAGLHEAEKTDILRALKELKDLGNSVIVVEHDQQTIRQADHLIDIGPKAGAAGGQIVYQGDLTGLLACPQSLTGQYLSGKRTMPERRSGHLISKADQRNCLTLANATSHNLKNLTVSFPLGALVGIAGKSGSGKSSLISNSLVPLLNTYDFTGKKVEDVVVPSVIHEKLIGLEHLTGFAEISQAPIGRMMSSNPASYIGIWDPIRKLFATEAKLQQRELTAGHFSFNSKGACQTCGGSGTETIWLGGDLKAEKICSICHGQRFNQEALAITYHDKTIAEVLALTVAEAVTFFAEQPSIIKVLTIMERIGMGYLTLGQPTPTLSGGEAQRIKLAKEIGRRRKGAILYILDEPTTGLSQYDIAKLLELLDELVLDGHSVIVIEHDPLILSRCDWLIELGPEGGSEGGQLIAEGSPFSLQKNQDSIIGRYL